MASLKDKVVIITGAGSGIGKAGALVFAARGARVVLAGRREEKLAQTAALLPRDSFLIHKTDVSRPEEVRELFDNAEKVFGGVDILINCAGKGLKAPFDRIPFSAWEEVLRINLSSVFLCTREAVSRMKAQNRRGQIITISSLAGLFNMPGYSAYCTTKHGVTSFMRSIKWELFKAGIKSRTIHPYKVNTDFFNTYEKPPGRNQMLSPMDIGYYLAAIGEGNRVKINFHRLANFFKRFYYLIRYTFFP